MRTQKEILYFASKSFQNEITWPNSEVAQSFSMILPAEAKLRTVYVLDTSLHPHIFQPSEQPVWQEEPSIYASFE